MKSLIYLPFTYLSWHLSSGLNATFQKIKNKFARFNVFFAIGLTLKTLFQPMLRVYESAQFDLFNPVPWISKIIINFLSRIVGFIFRTIFLLLSIPFYVGFMLFSFFYLIFWTFLPFFSFTFLVWSLWWIKILIF